MLVARDLPAQQDPPSLEFLLQNLDKKELEIKEKLGKTDDEIDMDFLRGIQRTREILAQIEGRPFMSYRKVVNPNPYNWSLTLPPKFTPEVSMKFSEEDFERFREALTQANSMMDELIGIYCEGAKMRIIDSRLKRKYFNMGDWNSKDDDAGGHPVRVSWKTFALPGFLDNPLLGKEIYFVHAIENRFGHLRGRDYSFSIINTRDDRMTPKFSYTIGDPDSNCETFKKIDKRIREKFILRKVD